MALQVALMRCAAFAFGLLALAGSWWEARAGWAQYLAAKNSRAALTRALEWTPGDARLWRQLGAATLEQDPAAAKPALANAIAFDRYDAESRAALGLLKEADGRTDEAERDLAEAAATSHRVKPKLALASFYFRSGRIDEFWRTAAEAARVQSADLTPAFALASRLDDPPERVASRLGLRADRLAAYVSFLLNQPLEDRVGILALQLPSEERYRNLLGRASERLVASGQTAEAVAVWNRFGARLDASQGRSLTDSGFTFSPRGGFGWRIDGGRGIDLRAAPPAGLRIDFSGHQAAAAALVEQYVPVLPGRRYTLVTRYRTDGLASPTGLRWVVLGLHDSAGAGSRALEPAPDGSSEFEFVTGLNTDLLRLVLNYQREAGAARLDGRLTLLSVELKLIT
jgi:hypothetical protein